MASVGESVRKALDDWEAGDNQFAMLHACNAVDGTARKLFPKSGSNQRFTGFLRDNYSIFGPMAMPGVDLVNTRWPVKVERAKAAGGLPDIAEVIYGVHRCCHGHGEELPDGFELLRDASNHDNLTQLHIEKGRVRLSDRTIFGLLAVSVLSSANANQRVPRGYYLSFAGTTMIINDWWGRTRDFAELVAKRPMPQIKLDFGDWMQNL